MAETVNYKCPACGAALRYDSASSLLTCDWCDSAFTPEDIEALLADKQARSDARATAEQQQRMAQVEDEDQPTGKHAADPVLKAEKVSPEADAVQEYLKRSTWSEEESAHVHAFSCASCGAALFVDDTTAATSCPYCENNTIIPGTLNDGLRPDFVIPFNKTKADAVQALTDFYKNKRFLPKSFSSENRINEIRGVYVPFWLYSAHANGNGTFRAKTIVSWTDGEYDCTDISHYRATRQGSMDFYRIPADGSTKMPDAHMDAIEPFDYSKMVPFSTAYLPGFLAERYDLTAEQCQERPDRRINATVSEQLQNTVTGYTEVSQESLDVATNYFEKSYALLPVWMLHSTWQGKDYLFAMNGQTGRLVGNLPSDPKRIAAWFAGIFAPVFAAVAVIAYLVL